MKWYQPARQSTSSHTSLKPHIPYTRRHTSKKSHASLPSIAHMIPQFLNIVSFYFSFFSLNSQVFIFLHSDRLFIKNKELVLIPSQGPKISLAVPFFPGGFKQSMNEKNSFFNGPFPTLFCPIIKLSLDFGWLVGQSNFWGENWDKLHGGLWAEMQSLSHFEHPPGISYHMSRALKLAILRLIGL